MDSSSYGRGEARDHVPVAELHERCQPLGDVLRRPDRLVRPRAGPAVVLEDGASTRRASSSESRIRTGPIPVVRSISRSSRPTASQCWRSICFFAPHVLDAAAEVVSVGVARDEPKRDLLAPAADSMGRCS